MKPAEPVTRMFIPFSEAKRRRPSRGTRPEGRVPTHFRARPLDGGARSAKMLGYRDPRPMSGAPFVSSPPVAGRRSSHGGGHAQAEDSQGVQETLPRHGERPAQARPGRQEAPQQPQDRQA